MSRLMMGLLLTLLPLQALAIYRPLAQSIFDEEIIEHKYYTLSYSEPHEVSRWISYTLELFQLQNCVNRTNSFKVDPLVRTGSATQADYQGSGFDRGHLLPAGDMKWNKTAMQETFYFSNMTPQPANFNRGKWGTLEELVRAWVLKYKKLWIVTGPVLKDNLAVIGPQQVVVPEQYYKVILRQEGKKYLGIGLLISTDVPHSDIKSYTTSINHIEAITNIDFFPFLETESIEDEVDYSKWDFKAKFSYPTCEIE
ncbi:MAG: DNA/RNA non-specific endonuclease [Bacteriovoracaceae bacterium]